MVFIVMRDVCLGENQIDESEIVADNTVIYEELRRTLKIKKSKTKIRRENRDGVNRDERSIFPFF